MIVNATGTCTFTHNMRGLRCIVILMLHLVPHETPVYWHNVSICVRHMCVMDTTCQTWGHITRTCTKPHVTTEVTGLMWVDMIMLGSSMIHLRSHDTSGVT